MKKKLKNYMFSRLAIVGVLILIQLLTIILVIWKLSTYFIYFYILSLSLSMIIVIYLISKNDNPSYKLAWAVPILLFPVFGGLFYVIAGNNKKNKKLMNNLKGIYVTTIPFLQQEEKIISEIQEQDKSIANQVRYITNFSCFPIYKNTMTEYLTPGELFYKRLMEELEKAEHYIFMEYFIVQEGMMWNSVLEVLERKAKQGVDVRMMYDDIGCLSTLPYNYNEVLGKKGIKCKVFNRLLPVLSIVMNNRDHRKITVIDGKVGFMGGINLADEYINKIVKHGHWKDAAIMLKGEAVWNLSMMFLQNWNYNEKEPIEYTGYRPFYGKAYEAKENGYVLPFSDSPLDNETVGENVYLNILHKAKDYVYINTPYLVVDNELVTALVLAAKGGVDVRIVTPHIEDKWYVHILTRAYYEQLIEAGVKIYEYTPGFMHSKTFVCDDELGVVGSINMDYRSLYLHFECATWLYKSKTIFDIKKDFIRTLEICTPITLEFCRKVAWPQRCLRAVLRLFAPLM